MNLFTQEEFENKKQNETLPIKCENCGKVFYLTKRQISKNGKKTQKFCSKQCFTNSRKAKIDVVCENCGKKFLKLPSQISQTNHNFCSKSCAASYNNVHKTSGTRRSKLECWLELKLLEKYPNLVFLFNDKTAINSELDIYIPSLKLAFELNGIFHYEPIFGDSKLEKIRHNDSNKFQLCQENKISLCVIDTSSQKYMKESTSIKFLNIITTIIDSNLNK